MSVAFDSNEDPASNTAHRHDFIVLAYADYWWCYKKGVKAFLGNAYNFYGEILFWSHTDKS